MKGIMFKEELFKKIIKGEKTETRRVIKVTAKEALPPHYEKPRYNPGEVVYLKEPFFKLNASPDDETILYAFDFLGSERNALSWKNKMFMPARAARYHIKITAAAAERVQDITASSSIKEGIDRVCDGIWGWRDYNEDVGVYQKLGTHATLSALQPVNSFKTLWNSINKTPYAWENNPWVWVYKFELHDLESRSVK